MKSQPRPSPKDLGEMLIAAKIISDENLREIQELQAKQGGRIEDVMLQERIITPQQLAFFTSMQLRIPFINLKREGIQPEAIALIPERLARKHGVMPIKVTDDTIVVAMSDPKEVSIIDELETLT